MAKRVSGALTEREQAELDGLLTADKEVAQQQQLLEKVSFNSVGKLTPGQKEGMLDRIMGNIAMDEVTVPVPENARPWRRYLLLAGMCVLLMMITGISGYMTGWLGGRKDSVAEWSTVQTKPGSKSRVTLPDGTLVVLNAGSVLSYPNDFGQKKREVQLTGEGYFDVVKIAEHPFVIHTPTIDVKVLGTTFNVRAYGDESHTEAALISGGIEITVNDERKQRITLSPHQKLLVANAIIKPDMKHQEAIGEKDKGKNGAAAGGNSKSLIVLETIEPDKKDSTIQETAWIDNRFVYRNENFSQLIKRIERWYDIIVECNNQQLLNSPFTGNVQQESLEQLLKVLQQTKHFEYNISARKVVIH